MMGSCTFVKVPGLGGLKETQMFLPHPRVKVSIVGSLRDREVACLAADRQGSNFESCVWRTVSYHSSHHPQEVLLAQFSLYVHKGGLKPDSFQFPTKRDHFSYIYLYIFRTLGPHSTRIRNENVVPAPHFKSNSFFINLPNNVTLKSPLNRTKFTNISRGKPPKLQMLAIHLPPPPHEKYTRTHQSVDQHLDMMRAQKNKRLSQRQVFVEVK